MTRRHLTARGKKLEACAILRRIHAELSNLPVLLNHDRDADVIRGKIIAAKEIVELARIDLETRLDVH